MARSHSQYVCQQCGFSQVGWAGKCPECAAWGSLVETIISSPSSSKADKSSPASQPIPLHSIRSSKTKRLSTQIPELDRILGGGLVPGQVTLLAGEPGIGKSTILLQLCQKLSSSLYISGEESVSQIKLRADRLNIKNKNLSLLEETDVDSILASIRSYSATRKLQVIIIDSVQTLSTADLSGMAGSVGQVRESAFRLTQLAKELSLPVFLVGHVTKEGAVAGPATLAHMVDTVLWFEGDKDADLRLLRSIKNRFGPTDEIGIFTMADRGLLSVTDENIFISDHAQPVPGSAVTCTLEGTRPVLVEIQSLVIPTKTPFPKRIAQGIDPKRLEVILAVLSRRCALPVYEKDVFVNVVGGISIKEPAADLGVALSVASAFFNKPLAKNLLALGEVGLSGEIRSATLQARRAKLARRRGFSKLVTHQRVPTLKEAIRQYLK